MKSVNKQIVVITGATAGVGRAIAREFARRGAKLGLIARGEIKLAATLKEVRKLGAEAITCSVDVSNQQGLEQAAQQIDNELGPIDIWINNAMVTMIGEVKDLSADEIKRVMEVNYLGSVNGILVANRRFLGRNGGHIIQIGSALSYISIPLQSAYCASKHAIHGFIQSFRIELKAIKSKIKVTEVHLPAVNTPQFEWMKNHTSRHPKPVPPIFEPELMARAVAHIAEHPRKELWVCAPTLKAILAEKFVPWLVEWKLARDGFDAQQTTLAPPTGQSNLWRPIEHDYGARGIFGKEAKDHSSFLWMNLHRPLVLISALFAGLGIFKLSGGVRKLLFSF